MIEKGRISAGQMVLLLFISLLGVTMAYAHYLSAKWAKQDSWLTPVVAAASGMAAFTLAYLLHQRFSGETVIQYCPRILGWFGKGVALLFLAYYIHAASFFIRIYTDFVSIIFLPKTPRVILTAGMVLVCASAVRGGLETVVRSAQFLSVLAIGIFSAVTLLTTAEWETENMFPILEHGAGPVVRGAAAMASTFNDFFLAAFFLPYLKKGGGVFRWGVVGVVGLMLVLMLFEFVIVFTLGNQAGNFIIPLYEAHRLISLANFVEHLDAFLLATWSFVVFIKISLLLYVIVMGTAQWLGLSDYKPLSLPMGLILIVLCDWIAPNLIVLNQYYDGEAYIISGLVQIVIPLILLGVAKIRKVKGTQSEDGAASEQNG